MAQNDNNQRLQDAQTQFNQQSQQQQDQQKQLAQSANGGQGLASTTPPPPRQGPSQPDWTNDPQFAGMDPALKQIYVNSGQTPAGRGTGFADWQYWQNNAGPSQYQRLSNDIAGTGSDATTGTPWASGSWQNSGGQNNPNGISSAFLQSYTQPVASNAGNFLASMIGSPNFDSGNPVPQGSASPALDANWIQQQGVDPTKLQEYGFTQGANGNFTGALSKDANGNYVGPNGKVVSGGDLQWLQGQMANHPGTSANQDLYNTLVGRANQSLNINPTTDSIIQPQVSNYAAAQTRQSRQALNDMAESSSPYATGAVNNARTQLAENAQQNTASMQSQLVQNELTQRRTEIQNALSEMGSQLTADQQMALQKELGLIDAGIQQQQVSNNYALGLGQLGLGQQQINSNNDQFAANYGLNSANQNKYWDWMRQGGNG